VFGLRSFLAESTACFIVPGLITNIFDASADIYLGTNVTTGEEVAMKLESTKSKHPQLV
jgi:hypothetical protein